MSKVQVPAATLRAVANLLGASHPVYRALNGLTAPVQGSAAPSSFNYAEILPTAGSVPYTAAPTTIISDVAIVAQAGDRIHVSALTTPFTGEIAANIHTFTLFETVTATTLAVAVAASDQISLISAAPSWVFVAPSSTTYHFRLVATGGVNGTGEFGVAGTYAMLCAKNQGQT